MNPEAPPLAAAVPGLVRRSPAPPPCRSTTIAARAGGHFTAKEFRTWNVAVPMALALANAGPSSTLPGRQRTVAASVREVANWLGDTPAVARGSYIDPRLGRDGATRGGR
jgi:DNA topoisomerase IB